MPALIHPLKCFPVSSGTATCPSPQFSSRNFFFFLAKKKQPGITSLRSVLEFSAFGLGLDFLKERRQAEKRRDASESLL